MIEATATRLWSHQQNALEFVHKKDGKALLALETGLGKTRTVIEYIRAAQPGLTLIVCPKKVLPVWEQQFQDWYPGQYQILRLDLQKPKYRAQSIKAASTEAGTVPLILLANYELVWREPLRTYLLHKAKLDLVVADESQKLKSPGSKVSRFMQSLGRRVPARICLSATPLHDKPLDVYGQFRFIDPTLYGENFQRFKNRYVEYDENGPYVPGIGYVRIKAYRNQDEFSDKYFSRTFTAGKELLDLPPVVYTKRYCQLGSEARKAYKQLDKDFTAEVRDGRITVANALVKLLRLQEITSGFTTLDGVPEGQTIDLSKRELLADVLQNDIPEDQAVVAFGKFRYDLTSIRFAAQKAGRDYFEVSGRRNDAVAFNRFGEGAVIGVQTQAGGVGIDLTRASYGLFYTLGYSHGDYVQAIGRLHRPGQDRSVVIMHLLAEGTIDTKVDQLIKDKGNLIDKIVEGAA